jgi:hypothetical protein
MAWTVNKLEPRAKGDRLILDVEFFKDGSLVHRHTFESTGSVGADWPMDGIRRVLTRLTQIEAEKAQITSGPVTVEPEPPPAPSPAPTAADLARNEFFRRRELYFQAKRHGEFKPEILNSTKFKALQQWLADNFKPEYLPLD